MSCCSNEKRGSWARCCRLRVEPVSRLSTPTTVCPSPSRASQRWEPRNPAAPVTKTRILLSRLTHGRGAGAHVVLAWHYIRPTDTQVGEAVLAHHLGLKEIAAVNDNGVVQQAAKPSQIEVLELFPLGKYEQRIGTAGGGV